MVIAGGNAGKLVCYPIRADPSRPGTRLTNWAIMARLGDGAAPPPRRADWRRPGRRDEALPFVRDRFRLGFVDPAALRAAIVLANRRGGPEGVIDLVEARAPGGFADLDAVASPAERAAIVRGCAALAGYALDQVNRR